MTWYEMIDLACSEFGCTADILVRTPTIKFSGSFWNSSNSEPTTTVRVSRKQEGKVTKITHVTFVDGSDVPKENARRYFCARLEIPYNEFK